MRVAEAEKIRIPTGTKKVVTVIFKLRKRIFFIFAGCI
jgi:hypothetical protein